MQTFLAYLLFGLTILFVVFVALLIGKLALAS